MNQALTLQHLRISGELLQRAQKQDQEKQAQAQAVDAKIPDVVQALQGIDYILPSQAEKVAQALHDPVQALELLKNFALRRASEHGASLGQGVKTAAAVPDVARSAIDAPITNYDETTAGQEFRLAILGQR